MTSRFGIIGNPLSHSFSQGYFNNKFTAEGIEDCSYHKYEIRDPSEVLELLAADNTIKGLNVTIPHKVSIIKYLDRLSPEAESIGAVNVIKVIRDGENVVLEGYNTDYFGFRTSLLNLIGAKRPEALILGNGGASMAVRSALGNLGIPYNIVSRRGDENIMTYERLDPEIVKRSKLIINTTPLGMHPEVNTAPPIDYSLLEGHILFDLVYNPEVTLFMKRGEERGCVVSNGYEMLILQAEKSWEIWTTDSSTDIYPQGK